MRIALIFASPTAKLYPLALLKIGAMLKSDSHEVELFTNRLPRPEEEYGEAWISTCFTFDLPAARAIAEECTRRYKRTRVGGIAATLIPDAFRGLPIDLHAGILHEAERFPPDYSLLGHLPEYSISHTSRGCSRKCAFCMVSRVEPRFIHRPEWPQDLHPATKTVQFWDNNWLAKNEIEWLSDVEKLRDLVRAKRVTSFDFNQSLDCRLMTEKKAKALEGLPMRPVRFAFDGKQEEGHYQRAVRLMHAHGFNLIVSDVLWNFNETPEDLYHRLRVGAELSDELQCMVASFPMRYQPILSIDPHRSYVGKHWTDKERTAFLNIKNRIGDCGIVSPVHTSYLKAIDEFELYFGKTPREFRLLLNYPRLKELMDKKKGDLSLRRAHERERIKAQRTLEKKLKQSRAS